MTGTTTYALLAVPFLAVAALVAVAAGIVAARRRGVGERRVGGRWVGIVSAVVAGAVLLVMTGVFNNVIVGLGIVAYDPALVSGARIGLFPVEDLAYSIGAALLLPSSWVLLERPGTERPDSERPGTDRPDTGRPGTERAGRAVGAARPVRSERPRRPSRRPDQPPRRPEETP
ncbi:lycopene cyclase domain-containing protein [Curtobacterium caseinilyticum]|uniref:Lycopene cyclase domain-containing protein n=1 Tax=Curtobacterium caseinilyticum TaxID=3055137 RepID=A0ABT7TT73_9MICO|nr:lycopene cyclase domain-containing protein [Curtobacterium caseinilyticum]MDM7892067.1 lycopene cyclase domain-containing protein [Curtobacterium caseinilyticum]